MAKKGILMAAIVIVGLAVVGAGAYSYFNKSKVTTNQELVESYTEPKPVESLEEEYDVIVIGGEPEGVAAAVSAARNGAKTLLVEERAELGGLFTYGMLNFLDIPQGADGESVSRGIYQEWHSLVGGGNAFGILEAKAAFKKLVDEEENITLSPNTEVLASEVKGNIVTAVRLKNEFGEFTVSGKAFIDATQDADFAVMSNAPYFTGGEDIGIKDKKMAVTLMIHLKNVDWDKVKETAKSEKFGPADVNHTVAWGFSDLHYDYKPVEENTRLRGLNLVKIGDEYFINALQIFGIDGLSEESKQEAIEKGKRETEHILQFLRAEFPGFENAEIISIPTELYVRETRHIWAEYQLPMSDVWMNMDHWDSIGMGGYPVDVQAQTPQDYGYVLSAPKQYGIPFRSLVPQEIDGLLVVGRSTGYSSLAAGSARVVPTGMVTGEAAGAAAVLAMEEDLSFRELSKNKALVEVLRERLDEQGAYVDHFELDYPYQGEWFDESVQTLMDYGLVVGGYTNDLLLENEATRYNFANKLKGGIERANPAYLQEIGEKLNKIHVNIYASEDGPMEKDEAADRLVELFFDKKDAGNSWQTLIDEGFISDEMAENIPNENHVLNLKELYALNAAAIDWVLR